MCGGDGAAATDASADNPGRETLVLLPDCPFGRCNTLEVWVEAEEGREISCPSGGRGDGALLSIEGPVIGGRLLSIGSGLIRRSTGADP